MKKIYNSYLKIRKKRGFTLIEMMIVVAIIALLAGMAVPQYQQYVKRSESVEAVRLMKQVADAEVAYYGTHNKYIENMGPLMVELPESNFDITVVANNTDKCFRVRASLGSSELENTVYLVYPDGNGSNCVNFENATDTNGEYWDNSIYYGCYFETCTSSSN